MLDMVHNILIDGRKLNYLEKVVIEKDIDKLGDTATIRVPGMKASMALEVEEKIKRGMSVQIFLGYDQQLNPELTGYVASVTTDNNITIQVEDGMFDFHVPAKNQILKEISAPDLIREVVTSAGLAYHLVVGENVGDISFTKFELRNVSVYEALAKIKQQTGYNLYVRGRDLIVQLRHFSEALDTEVRYDFSRNVEKSSLKYVREEERKLLVEVVGLDKSNRKVTVEVGEPGGDKITQLRYNTSDKKVLEALGREILKKYSYTGYEGTLTGWLIPYVTFGYKARIINPEYPGREGSYLVENVKTEFSAAGGVRTVGLGVQL